MSISPINNPASAPTPAELQQASASSAAPAQLQQGTTASVSQAGSTNTPAATISISPAGQQAASAAGDVNHDGDSH